MATSTLTSNLPKASKNPHYNFANPQNILAGLYVLGKFAYLTVHEHHDASQNGAKIRELSVMTVKINNGTQKENLQKSAEEKTGLKFEVKEKLGSLKHGDSRWVVQAEVYKLQCRSVSAEEIESKLIKLPLKDVVVLLARDNNHLFSVAGHREKLPISALTREILFEYKKRHM